MAFTALVIERDGAGAQRVARRAMEVADLMPGAVTVRVTHSTVNYKDGLALTGKAPVVRRFPMIPGIDLAGVVEASDDAGFAPGDRVLVTGQGLGETHYGAYAGRARLDPALLVPLPEGLKPEEAMAIGTAGFTAMQCVIALERHGLDPSRGPVLVTGAAGGVGSVAVAVMARLGWRVVASTGRTEEADYLRRLGAAEVIDRAELSEPGRPLAKERWAAGVDAVGGRTLVNALAATRWGGAIAACGLAGGMDLPGTVAPFILRNVALLGVDSLGPPRALRLEVWRRLGADLDRGALAAMTTTVGFEDLEVTAAAILEGRVKGRVVVDMAGAAGA